MNPIDTTSAARLIQWGLRVKERPSQNTEYRDLVKRHQEDALFAEIVNEIAAGMGIKVLAVGNLGVVLTPLEDSPFAFRPAEFRPNRGAEERLLDGLVQIAIAATIFPRATDLEDEATQVRQPTSVGEVEETLRTLAKRSQEQAATKPDPPAGSDHEGITEAWRVYQSRLAARETSDGRQAAKDTRRIIEVHLERLCEMGCFLKDGPEDNPRFQPLWRYQVLVRELAALHVYELVTRSKEAS